MKQLWIFSILSVLIGVLFAQMVVAPPTYRSITVQGYTFDSSGNIAPYVSNIFLWKTYSGTDYQSSSTSSDINGFYTVSWCSFALPLEPQTVYINATLDGFTQTTPFVYTSTTVGCINPPPVFDFNITFCMPNWVRDASSNCSVSDPFVISYSDANNCNSTANLPADNGTIITCPPSVISTTFFGGSCLMPPVLSAPYTYNGVAQCFSAGMSKTGSYPVKLTIIKNDSTVLLNDVSLTQISATNYAYSSPITFDVGGSWNLIVTTSNDNETNVYTTTFSVSSPPCTESWVVSLPACNSGNNVSKVYIDENNCGTTSLLPLDNGSVIVCPNYALGGGGATPSDSVANDMLPQPMPAVTANVVAETPNVFVQLWDWILSLFK